MSLYSTYDQIGLAEDVSDIITNISPTKTPFQSSIGNESISAKNPQWQQDTLRTAADNKALEGFIATDVARTPTVMLSNVTQIFSDVFRVTNTSDAVKTYGRAKETAYQLAKTGEELKRDFEFSCVGISRNLNAGAETVTPRNMTSAIFSSGGTGMIHSSNVIAGGTAALTETMVLNCQKAVFDNGGEPTILSIKPSDSIIVANFAAASGRTRDFSQDKKVTNVVDLYVSPYGEVKVVLNRFQLSTVAFMYDPANYKKLTLRPWARTMLAIDGDSTRHMVVGEFSLKAKSNYASGLINAIT